MIRERRWFIAQTVEIMRKDYITSRVLGCHSYRIVSTVKQLLNSGGVVIACNDTSILKVFLCSQVVAQYGACSLSKGSNA